MFWRIQNKELEKAKQEIEQLRRELEEKKSENLMLHRELEKGGSASISKMLEELMNGPDDDRMEVKPWSRNR